MGDISNGTRILLTQYLLKRLTDETHALSRDELIKKIGGLGTTISSNTIKADIESIKSYNNLIKEHQDDLLAPFKCQESGSIDYATRQKKGAYVEKTYYTDTELIILTRLLKRLDRQDNLKLLEKVLSDSSLYKINRYHLLDNINIDHKDEQIMKYLELIIKAINTFSCLSFRKMEYSIAENKIVDTQSHKTILLYPTNIDIKNDQLYLVGYLINSSEDFELAYYRIDRINRLKITRTPKYVQVKTECFKDKVWMFNDPLNIEKNNIVNLDLRVYLGNENIIEDLYQKFNGCTFTVEQFRQFANVTIENVPNDDRLYNWFLQYSNQIEVFKPLELRDRIKEEIGQMYSTYRSK